MRALLIVALVLAANGYSVGCESCGPVPPRVDRGDAGADAGALDSGAPDAGYVEPWDGGLGYACTGGPTVFSTGMSARFVIGQPDFTSEAPNAGQAVISNAGFDTPVGLAIDRGRLFVSDSHNHRVLIYDHIPTANGAVADHVLGQPDFSRGDGGTGPASMCDPQGLALTARHLVVAELCNSRVSFWPLDALDAGGPAAFAVGQPDLVTGSANTGGLSASSLQNPASVRVSGSRLLISDSGNNRVLMFDQLPGGFGAAADRAIGQTDLGSNTAGAGLDQLDFPLDLVTDGTRLVIVDDLNDRTLMFDALPATNGARADVMLGGSAFPATPTSQDSPVGAALYGAQLFVSDRRDARILYWSTLPRDAGTLPDAYLGQVNTTDRSGNHGLPAPAADTLYNPHWLVYDGCRLFAVDQFNNRIVVY